MREFTATARKDGRWWVVQCDQYPDALSQVARLGQAEAHQREAIAFVADLDEDEISVTVVPLLDVDVARGLDQVRKQRAEAERLQRNASERIVKLTKELLGRGLSMRDVGEVLGVSHQRVAQLAEGWTAAAKKAPAKKAPAAAKKAPAAAKKAPAKKAPAKKAPAKAVAKASKQVPGRAAKQAAAGRAVATAARR